jgi:hypothetical protein
MQFISAIQLRDDFFEAQDALGRIFIEMKKWDEARALYKSVLSRHPDDSIARYAISFLELAPGDRMNLNEMALFGIPYSKLTSKSTLWPFYP